MAVHCKGLQHIKTLSGAVGTGSHSVEHHVHYFKIGCLELERSRRNKERHANSKNILEIDRRLDEIEDEIHQRQASIASTSMQQGKTERSTRQMHGFSEQSKVKTIRY